MYKIREISYVEQESYEQLGTKEKFWLNNRQFLLKAEEKTLLKIAVKKLLTKLPSSLIYLVRNMNLENL